MLKYVLKVDLDDEHADLFVELMTIYATNKTDTIKRLIKLGAKKEKIKPTENSNESTK